MFEATSRPLPATFSLLKLHSVLQNNMSKLSPRLAPQKCWDLDIYWQGYDVLQATLLLFNASQKKENKHKKHVTLLRYLASAHSYFLNPTSWSSLLTLSNFCLIFYCIVSIRALTHRKRLLNGCSLSYAFHFSWIVLIKFNSQSWQCLPCRFSIHKGANKQRTLQQPKDAKIPAEFCFQQAFCF